LSLSRVIGTSHGFLNQAQLSLRLTFSIEADHALVRLVERGPDGLSSVKGGRLRRPSRSDGEAALYTRQSARQEALQALQGEPRPCPVLAPTDG